LERDNKLYIEKIDDLRQQISTIDSDRTALRGTIQQLTSQSVSLQKANEELSRELAQERQERRKIAGELRELKTAQAHAAHVTHTRAVSTNGDSFFVTQSASEEQEMPTSPPLASTSLPQLQAVLTGSAISGGSCQLVDGDCSLLFNDVPVGNTATHSLTIENTAKTPTVFEVYLIFCITSRSLVQWTVPRNSSVFSVTPSSGVLMEGERTDLVFSFTPQRSESSAASISCDLRSLASGDSKSGTVTVRGKGVLRMDSIVNPRPRVFVRS